MDTDVLGVPTATLLFGRSHPGCPGVLRSGVKVGEKLVEGVGKRPDMRPGLFYCSHPSHEGQTFNTCLDCGEQGELTEFLGCVDVDGCEERQAERTRSHPLWPMLQETKRVAEQKRAEANAEKAEARRAEQARLGQGEGGERPRKVKEADPLGGRCNHCGEPTKGGRFVAGHDAKLKGDLMRAAVGGDGHAILEMLHRGWLKRPQLLDPAKLAEAQAAFEAATEVQAVEFLQKRNEGRWAQAAAFARLHLAGRVDQ